MIGCLLIAIIYGSLLFFAFAIHPLLGIAFAAYIVLSVYSMLGGGY